MKHTGKSLSRHVRWLLAATVALLTIMWGLVYYTLSQSAHERLQEAQTTTRLQADMYAQNTRSTIKRLDELLLGFRASWSEDWGRFAKTVQAHQAHTSDIPFQIAVINAEGYLAFNSPAPATSRMDLRDREYFRVHKGTTQAQDRLFISRPLKGRTTARWSIQFTRPIWKAGAFAGVIVASITADTLSRFHSNLHLSDKGLSGMVRDSGEVVAYHPGADEMLGKTLAWLDAKLTEADAGSLVHVTSPDGIERVFAYQKLPEYHALLFVAESLEHAMQPHYQYRTTALLSAGVANMLLLVLSLHLYRKLAAREQTPRLFAKNEERPPAAVPRTAAKPSSTPAAVTRRDRASRVSRALGTTAPVHGMQGTHPASTPAPTATLPLLPASVAEPASDEHTKTAAKMVDMVDVVDVEQVHALLYEILPRLEQRRFSAIPRFQKLQKLLAGSQHAQALDEAGELLLEMRFDQALERLRHIMQTAGWDTTGTGMDTEGATS